MQMNVSMIQLSRTGAKPRRFLVWLAIAALIGGGVGVVMRSGESLRSE